MRTTLQEIMSYAEIKQIAAGAFEAASLEAAQAIIESAEERKEPVILQYAPVHEPVVSLHILGPVLVRLAEEASIPVCVHLDQTEDLEKMRQALDMGFTSITAGGGREADLHARLCHLEFTCQAAELAAKYHASLEGELGGTVESPYTDPQEAAAFVRNSGVDVLAASFGVARGAAADAIDWECLREVRRKTCVPIVIRDGSELPAEVLNLCIEAGVRKIGFHTACARAAAEYVRSQLSPDLFCETTCGSGESGTPVSYEQITMWGREAFRRQVTVFIKQLTGRHSPSGNRSIGAALL